MGGGGSYRQSPFANRSDGRKIPDGEALGGRLDLGLHAEDAAEEGGGEDLGGRAVGGEAPLVQDEEAVGVAGGEGEVVEGRHDGAPFERRHAAHEVVLVVDVE